MKARFFDFLLFVYIEHIKEDWDDYTPFGRAVIYPFWWIKSAFVWAVSPILLPEYAFKRSNFYAEMMRFKSEMERKWEQQQ